jgi:hypothetical protein
VSRIPGDGEMQIIAVVPESLSIVERVEHLLQDICSKPWAAAEGKVDANVSQDLSFIQSNWLGSGEPRVWCTLVSSWPAGPALIHVPGEFYLP